MRTIQFLMIGWLGFFTLASSDGCNQSDFPKLSDDPTNRAAIMRLPTAEEINPIPDDLDGQHAVQHFLGKTLEEAEALFREDSITYQEDLMFMGPSAFRFYVQAAINYIQSEAATGDSDIVNCIAGILESRLEFEPDELVAVAERLAEDLR